MAKVEKNEFEKLKKEKIEIHDRINVVRYKLKQLNGLKDRSTCPCCEQSVIKVETNEKLEKYEAEAEQIDERLDEIIPILNKHWKVIHEKNDKEKKLFEKAAMDFYEKNKKLFSRITREYRKGLNIMLPKFSEIEMKYWDHTMTYIHLNRKSMEDLEDEEDLFFNL